MRNGAKFKNVILNSASVASNVEMEGSTFDEELNAYAMHVGGILFMRNGAKFKNVILNSASVASDVEMDGSTFDGELNASAMHVGSSLFMSGGAKFKDVILNSASVASNADMDGSTFDGELNADAMHVGGSLFMRNGAKAANAMALVFVTIGQNLDLRGATLDSLDLSGVTVAGELRLSAGELGGRATVWRTAQGEPGDLILRNAKVGSLGDDKDAWPEKGHLRLEGFSFAHLGGFVETKGSEARERGAEWWDDWARRDTHYSPDPYQQLAAAFTLAGDKDLADDIRYKGKVREHETQTGLNWLWSAFLRWVAGFGVGNYPFRVLFWVGAISLAGALYLLKRSKGVRDKGHTFFWCWGASLSRLLPVIEINKEFSEFFNDPERTKLTARENAAFSIIGVFGWFLAAVLIAAVSGITGKS
jgi:hypothetical protein